MAHMNRNTLWLPVIVIIICFSILTPKPAYAENKNTAQLESELRLKQFVIEQLEKDKAKLSSDIQAQLKSHRSYLQELDDKFYQRITTWIPIISGVVALLIGAFLWSVGKTRKEAFETAQFIAIEKASELAQKKVSEIIVPDSILDEVKSINEETINQISDLRERLIKEVEKELIEARNEVVKNKQEVIMEAIDEAIRTKFTREFDIMDRLSTIESKVSEMSERYKESEERIKIEAIKQELYKSWGKDITISNVGKFVKWYADIIGKLIVRF